MLNYVFYSFHFYIKANNTAKHKNNIYNIMNDAIYWVYYVKHIQIS